MSYAIHGEFHRASQAAFVDQLLNAKRLSWPERVEHIVGLSSSTSASPRVQQLAKELLMREAGDARTALLDLLWAVQNADAGS